MEAFEFVLLAIEQRSYEFIPWPNWLYCNFSPTGRKFMRNIKKLQGLVNGIIAKRRKTAPVDEHDESQPRDLLDLLLAASSSDGQGFSDQQIMEEIMTFIFAGHETTSIALSWTLYLLAQHPEVEDRLVQELSQVMGTRPVPLVEDLPKLQYLDMVLCESMRLYPPQPAFVRRALHDNHIGEYFIAKDTEIAVVPYIIHRDPSLWSNPERFDPERFTKENSKSRHPFAYLPFSGGLRSCIGRNFALMEARILLSSIVRHFEVSLVGGSKVIAIPAVTLRPRGMHVSVASRL